MSHRADIAQLVRLAQEKGWGVRKTRNGHWRLVSPCGAVVFTGTTPSDHRSFLNFRATLRRKGLEV